MLKVVPLSPRAGNVTEPLAGAEIIGWDPSRGMYVTHHIGNDGPTDYEAELAEEEGVLT